MAGIFAGTSRVTISGTYKDTSRDLTVPTTPIGLQYPQTWVAGSGYRIFEDTITLVANTPQTLNLESLTDMYGDTLTFALVHAILIHNNSVTSGELLEVSGDWVLEQLMADWVDDAVKETVDPSGDFYRTSPVDGYGVESGTGDHYHELTLDPLTKGFTIDLVIWGTE